MLDPFTWMFPALRRPGARSGTGEARAVDILLRLVEDLDSGSVDASDPGRAGLIFVDYATAEEDCVVFTTESVFLTEYGLVYSRDGRIPNPQHLPLWHLYGRWYTFIRWD